MFRVNNVKRTSEKVGRYILGPLYGGNISALVPKGDMSSFVIGYLERYLGPWFVTGFLSIIIARVVSNTTSNEYFYEAASQLLAPLLWNIVVVLGLLLGLLGVLLCALKLTPLSKTFFHHSMLFLKFASEVGTIGLGVLLGLLTIAIYQSELASFWAFFAATIGLVLLSILLVLNILVWWVQYCIENAAHPSPYFVYVSKKMPLQISLCVFIVSVLLIALFTSKQSIKITNEVGNNSQAVCQEVKQKPLGQSG